MSLTLPNVLIDGTQAYSAPVMANFNAIVAYINGLALPTLPVTVGNGGTGATTAPNALTNLGLAGMVTIPGTAANAPATGTYNFVFTASPVAPTPASLTTGLTLCFLAPAALTPPVGTALTIQFPGLGIKRIFNTPTFGLTQSVALNQLLYVTYSAALDGWVLINTPPGGNNYLQVANNLNDVASTAAAIANLGAVAMSLFTTGATVAAAGSQPLPGGLILKWGTATLPASGGNVAQVPVTFPTAFPNNGFAVLVTPTRQANSGAGGFPTGSAQSLSTTGFQATGDTLGYTSFNQTVNVFWLALGN